MCGVPVHAADRISGEADPQGLSCPVWRKIEDPAEAKKRRLKSFVKRGSSASSTGNLDEDSLPESACLHTLASLGRSVVSWRCRADMVDGMLSYPPLSRASWARNSRHGTE